jgi:GNAT superfamily N-acetyltransferase
MAVASVRLATAHDAPEIARIQRTTWRSAYATVLPENALDAIDAAETERTWAETIERGPAVVLLALEGEWTVGFCAAGPAPEPELAAPDGSLPADAARIALISTLLVEPRWSRRGHGGRLLANAAERMRERGATRGIAWVLDGDSASLSFYRAAGWHPDGTVRTLDTGARPLREVRLTGELALRLRQPGEEPRA